MNIDQLHHGRIIDHDKVDARAARERVRRRRLWWAVGLLGLPLAWFWFRELTGDPVRPGVPGWLTNDPTTTMMLGLMVILACLILIPFLGAGHSPHTLLRPSDSNVRLDDVVGAEATRRGAVDTLNLFLAHETFATEMGGSPRRGVLFEALPARARPTWRRRMAAEAGAFLFVSASTFQSMYYGQTNRKIRSYFKALRKAARAEGGAIGFIEEFDAIGGARSGMNSGSMREGIVGVVNELLVQMQSFDLPAPKDRSRRCSSTASTCSCPTTGRSPSASPRRPTS
ncbi:MAG: AAA family ATPase [Ilumatobacteraceae bacterium]